MNDFKEGENILPSPTILNHPTVVTLLEGSKKKDLINFGGSPYTNEWVFGSAFEILPLGYRLSGHWELCDDVVSPTMTKLPDNIIQFSNPSGLEMH